VVALFIGNATIMHDRPKRVAVRGESKGADRPDNGEGSDEAQSAAA